MKPIKTSYGGGNQFISNLINYINNENENLKIVFDLNHNDIDLIFILDPRILSVNKINIDMVINYKLKYPNVKIIHRVNECDIKRDKSINIEPLLIKTMKISDHVIFVSKWLQHYFIKKYTLKLPSYNHILNGCNRKHFYPLNNQKFENGKIKIVTHHWSSNYLKGFHIYNELDKILPSLKNIEFTFIGNYNQNYKPKNIKLLPPTNGIELGELINKHDIYFTATQNEPCGNHYIEGLSVGLPILYCKGGGAIKELCHGIGEEFNDIKTLLIKIDLIKNNYYDYVNNINYGYLGSERCCKEYYKIITKILN